MSLMLILLFSSPVGFTQAIQEPIQLVEKFDDRRRGTNCGNPPDVWAISTCKTEFFCYFKPEDVSLWLPPVKRTEGSNFVTITNLTNYQEVTKRWQISDITIPWPITEVSLMTGAKYSIRLSNRNGSSSYLVILNAIPSELQDLTKQLEWMKEKGCTQQVEMLLEEQKS